MAVVVEEDTYAVVVMYLNGCVAARQAAVAAFEARYTPASAAWALALMLPSLRPSKTINSISPV